MINIKDERTKSFLAIFFSFLAWGTLVIYWDMTKELSSIIVVSYRIIFSILFVSIIITAKGGWSQTLKVLKDGKSILITSVCGFIIGCNWLLYVAAITSGHVVEASMGYYINPLANALIGAIIFREYLSKMQKIAIGIVAIGVGYMIIGYGQIPFFALGLTVTFAIYGALHKLLKVKVTHSMFYEMLILLVPAILVVLLSEGASFFMQSLNMKIILMLAGPFTILPLMGFAYGVQRLPLATVGIVQYSSPTATFILGIFYFKEAFVYQMLIVFSFIWIGVIVYVVDSALRMRSGKLKVGQS